MAKEQDRREVEARAAEAAARAEVEDRLRELEAELRWLRGRVELCASRYISSGLTYRQKVV